MNSMLINKKRERCITHSKKLDITLDQKEFFVQSDNLNYRITLASIMENGKNKLYVSCNQLKSSLKYEIELFLDILKEKSKTFRICNNLEETFKMLKNLLSKKKVKIKYIGDIMSLSIAMPNCIEYKEEYLNIELEKKEIYNKTSYSFEIDNNDINKILKKKEKEKEIEKYKINEKGKDNLKIKKKDKENEQENLNEFKQKINLLFKNDENKELRIRKLIISGGELLYDCYRLKKELKDLKKYIQYNEENLKMNENEKNEEEENKVIESIEKNKNIENIPDNTNENEIKLKEVNIKNKKNLFQCSNINVPPKIMFCKSITNKATCKYSGDNNFITFESIYQEKFLVYGTKNFTIHFYDFKFEKVTRYIKKAHDCEITNFRHIFDNNYNRDLLLSISDIIKNIKVWDVKNQDCLVNIRKAYLEGYLFSSCFLIDQIHKMNYIITVNYNKEFIKIYDFEGKAVSTINNSEDQSVFVDTFYNSHQKKYYIIVGNEKYIISYFFETGGIFRRYYDQGSLGTHMNFVFNFIENEINLVESDTFGYVRIWDFNTGLLLNKCLVGKNLKLRGICLWNQNYLFVGSSDKKLKLIDLENGARIDNIKCGIDIYTIKKVHHPIYGECLAFDGKSTNGEIQLWKSEN